ncbi:hypothetical protein RRG08_053880 [Elysia crispata]|uniref:Uncharacterized protein n=1 Tax=Elysia crispata TaxID=231223 RepID=A0AAE0YLT2_9GAST|nr:hypothetical protein RRG08_053880 [Elysia crispata]
MKFRIISRLPHQFPNMIIYFVRELLSLVLVQGSHCLQDKQAWTRRCLKARASHTSESCLVASETVSRSILFFSL